ncbi:MAG: FAD-dependent oxidoreductase [Lachnospiraceae bacterium]|jgi:thioredoxin reductase (NADPH)|nr:FAD-dependent oxidoreductase [Lachnospiraceae bacterium]
MRDLVIIGSGPAGLSAAVYGKRAGLDLLVIEKNPMSGGQVLNTYEVDNYLGLPGTNGFEMGMKFREHADRLEVPFLEAAVTAISQKEQHHIVHTNEGDFETKTILIATGADHAKLGVSGETQFAGMGVSYCATCDGAFYRGKTAAVVGGGDTALEDAIYLARFCQSVLLIHRRSELRGARILQEELEKLSNVRILYDRIVLQINGTETVDRLLLQNVKTAEEETVSTNGVFIAVGIRPQSDLFLSTVAADASGYLIAGEDGVSRTPGIFVAGDVRTKPLRQIVTAVSDGANAIRSINEYLLKRKG